MNGDWRPAQGGQEVAGDAGGLSLARLVSELRARGVRVGVGDEGLPDSDGLRGRLRSPGASPAYPAWMSNPLPGSRFFHDRRGLELAHEGSEDPPTSGGFSNFGNPGEPDELVGLETPDAWGDADDWAEGAPSELRAGWGDALREAPAGHGAESGDAVLDLERKPAEPVDFRDSGGPGLDARGALLASQYSGDPEGWADPGEPDDPDEREPRGREPGTRGRASHWGGSGWHMPGDYEPEDRSAPVFWDGTARTEAAEDKPARDLPRAARASGGAGREKHVSRPPARVRESGASLGDEPIDLSQLRIRQGEEGGLVSLDEVDAAFEPPKRPRLRIAVGAAIVLALGALALALMLSALQPSSSQTVPLLTPSQQAQTPAPGDAVTPQTAPVTVHVAGAVRLPGVYQLPSGSRVADAIDAAGGAGEDADPSALNLARVLRDGERIAVPRVGEQPAPEADPAGAAVPGTVPGPLNLNTASQAELEGLPRVGPALAGRIITYREQHGGFTSVEELKQVPGIGDSIFAELEPLVAV